MPRAVGRTSPPRRRTRSRSHSRDRHRRRTRSRSRGRRSGSRDRERVRRWSPDRRGRSRSPRRGGGDWPPPPPPPDAGWAPPPPPPPAHHYGGAAYPGPPYDGGGGGYGWAPPPPQPRAAPATIPPEEFAAAQKAGLSRLVAEAGRDGTVWWYLDRHASPHGPYTLSKLRAWARGLRSDPSTRDREYREFVGTTAWRDGAAYRVHMGTLLAVHRTRSPSPEGVFGE